MFGMLNGVILFQYLSLSCTIQNSLTHWHTAYGIFNAHGAIVEKNINSHTHTRTKSLIHPKAHAYTICVLLLPLTSIGLCKSAYVQSRKRVQCGVLFNINQELYILYGLIVKIVEYLLSGCCRQLHFPFGYVHKYLIFAVVLHVFLAVASSSKLCFLVIFFDIVAYSFQWLL